METKVTSVYFPTKKLYREFKQTAKKQGLSLRALLEKYMRIAVEEQKKKDREAREKKSMEDKATIEHFDR